MPDARYLVERPGDGYQMEDVGAAGFEVLPSGALEFVNEADEVLIVYAPGAWLTVCPEDGPR